MPAVASWRMESGLSFAWATIERLVAVVRGDEAADQRHAQRGVVALVHRAGFRVAAEPALEGVDHIEVAIHLLVLDQRAAEDELRDEHQRHEVRRRLCIRHDARK